MRCFVVNPAGSSVSLLLKILLWLLVTPGFTSAAGLKPEEQILLFPTLGQRVQDGWDIEIHGWVYEPERRRLLAGLLRRVVGIDEGELRAAEKATFKERTQLFFVDNERGKTFSIRVGESTRTLKTSAGNGHFTERLHLTADELRGFSPGGLTNGLLHFELPLAESSSRHITGTVHLLTEDGLSVISDIDDTIKVSQVLQKNELLRNTFCRPFQPVTGMAGVYQAWARSTGAQFHYVSASPWQLYLPLSEFTRANGFPDGTFHLKYFRVKDGTFLDLFGSPEKYKLGVIEPMLARFPKRRFVLVGDSGERDPEAYGALARKHPDQIVRIAIRDVTGEASDSDRYRKAFAGLPKTLWILFKEPAEIEKAF